jgi:YD repeat-containing protein
MNGNLWKVIVIGVFVAGIALASASATVSGAYTATATDNTTVSYQANYTVSDPDRSLLDDYDAAITVTTDDGNTTLAPGTDYQWHPADGVVDFENTTATSSGDAVSVTYEYDAYRESTSQIHALASSFNPVIGMAFLVVVLGAAWRIAHSGGGGF